MAADMTFRTNMSAVAHRQVDPVETGQLSALCQFQPIQLGTGFENRQSLPRKAPTCALGAAVVRHPDVGTAAANTVADDVSRNSRLVSCSFIQVSLPTAEFRSNCPEVPPFVTRPMNLLTFPEAVVS